MAAAIRKETSRNKNQSGKDAALVLFFDHPRGVSREPLGKHPIVICQYSSKNRGMEALLLSALIALLIVSRAA